MGGWNNIDKMEFMSRLSKVEHKLNLLIRRCCERDGIDYIDSIEKYEKAVREVELMDLSSRIKKPND